VGEVVRADEREGGVASGEAARGTDHQDPAPRRLLGRSPGTMRDWQQ
jgi:hypothetical protein